MMRIAWCGVRREEGKSSGGSGIVRGGVLGNGGRIGKQWMI
jgi:hypothetical protein